MFLGAFSFHYQPLCLLSESVYDEKIVSTFDYVCVNSATIYVLL